MIKGIDRTKNQELNKSELRKEIHELIDAGLSLSAASKYLSKKTGIKKSVIYDLK